MRRAMRAVDWRPTRAAHRGEPDIERRPVHAAKNRRNGLRRFTGLAIRHRRYAAHMRAAACLSDIDIARPCRDNTGHFSVS
ncbi:hypothetical protein WJ30_30055 [Burkholderia diffusa]|nr:hypothetical protein WJ30_30055 [Burkholderia diffusa]